MIYADRTLSRACMAQFMLGYEQGFIHAPIFESLVDMHMSKQTRHDDLHQASQALLQAVELSLLPQTACTPNQALQRCYAMAHLTLAQKVLRDPHHALYALIQTMIQMSGLTPDLIADLHPAGIQVVSQSQCRSLISEPMKSIALLCNKLGFDDHTRVGLCLGPLFLADTFSRYSIDLSDSILAWAHHEHTQRFQDSKKYITHKQLLSDVWAHALCEEQPALYEERILTEERDGLFRFHTKHVSYAVVQKPPCYNLDYMIIAEPHELDIEGYWLTSFLSLFQHQLKTCFFMWPTHQEKTLCMPSLLVDADAGILLPLPQNNFQYPQEGALVCNSFGMHHLNSVTLTCPIVAHASNTRMCYEYQAIQEALWNNKTDAEVHIMAVTYNANKPEQASFKLRALWYDMMSQLSTDMTV